MMLHLTEALVSQLVHPAAAAQRIVEAFESFGRQRAVVQPRRRSSLGGFKLSAMEAVLCDQGVAGAKIYSTVEGKFNFLIALFDTDNGAPLALVDGGAITRIRTAATSIIAARYLARPESTIIGLFGAGVQGCEHIKQLNSAYDIQRILVADIHLSERGIARLNATGLSYEIVDPSELLGTADIIVTASRAHTPLLDGAQLLPGALVIAIGSSLPNACELDQCTLQRASTIVVEWHVQSLNEAGELVAHANDLEIRRKLVDLAELISGLHPGRRNDSEIIVYKAVGIALEDIAVAKLAYDEFLSKHDRTHSSS